MARDSSGPRNEPQYAGTGAPADAADLTELGAYAARQGNVRADTRANRLLATGADLYNGLLWSETDTGIVYRYDGTAWRLLSTGLNLIKPTSVVSATLDAVGNAAFSAASPVSMNGVFSSLFDFYLIKLRVTAASAASQVSLRFRVGGVDDSSASYNNQLWYATGSTATATLAASVTSWQLMAGSGAFGHKADIEVSAPQDAAQRTMGTVVASDFSGGTGLVRSDSAFVQDKLAAYDGFTLIASSGNITGRLAVYGFYAG